MATFSFDSIKVWHIDFSSNDKRLDISMKRDIQQANVLSLLILPGNKYIVMGTKEGDLLLYNLAEAAFCQQIEGAHKKEIWELAMHSSPQIKNSRGELIVASASADNSIKFWNLTQSHNTGIVKL